MINIFDFMLSLPGVREVFEQTVRFFHEINEPISHKERGRIRHARMLRGKHTGRARRS